MDYDDSAFYYFAISILTVFLVPYSISLIKTMIKGDTVLELKGKNCECSRCKEVVSERQKVYKKTWIRFGFFIKLAVALVLWYCWYLTYEQIGNFKPLKSFDPFQILGVSPESDTATIKRAYRKLSLSKHPDKNPDDPLAVTEFIQITKAYTVSIDHNCTIGIDR